MKKTCLILSVAMAAFLCSSMTPNKVNSDLEGSPCNYGGIPYPEWSYAASRTNCNRYFICMEGVWYAQYCLPGLDFDEMSLTCDFPWEVTHFCGCRGGV